MASINMPKAYSVTGSAPRLRLSLFSDLANRGLRLRRRIFHRLCRCLERLGLFGSCRYIHDRHHIDTSTHIRHTRRHSLESALIVLSLGPSEHRPIIVPVSASTDGSLSGVIHVHVDALFLVSLSSHCMSPYTKGVLGGGRGEVAPFPLFFSFFSTLRAASRVSFTS